MLLKPISGEAHAMLETMIEMKNALEWVLELPEKLQGNNVKLYYLHIIPLYLPAYCLVEALKSLRPPLIVTVPEVTIPPNLKVFPA